jgi:uncharacterized membrane protein
MIANKAGAQIAVLSMTIINSKIRPVVAKVWQDRETVLVLFIKGYMLTLNYQRYQYNVATDEEDSTKASSPSG